MMMVIEWMNKIGVKYGRPLQTSLRRCRNISSKNFETFESHFPSATVLQIWGNSWNSRSLWIVTFFQNWNTCPLKLNSLQLYAFRDIQVINQKKMVDLMNLWGSVKFWWNPMNRSWWLKLLFGANFCLKSEYEIVSILCFSKF